MARSCKQRSNHHFCLFIDHCMHFSISSSLIKLDTFTLRPLIHTLHSDGSTTSTGTNTTCVCVCPVCCEEMQQMAFDLQTSLKVTRRATYQDQHALQQEVEETLPSMPNYTLQQVTHMHAHTHTVELFYLDLHKKRMGLHNKSKG